MEAWYLNCNTNFVEWRKNRFKHSVVEENNLIQEWINKKNITSETGHKVKFWSKLLVEAEISLSKDLESYFLNNEKSEERSRAGTMKTVVCLESLLRQCTTSMCQMSFHQKLFSFNIRASLKWKWLHVCDRWNANGTHSCVVYMFCLSTSGASQLLKNSWKEMVRRDKFIFLEDTDIW